jgi:ubiquinone/menaquinone biosynthesis C-methylase UbiE
MIKNFLSNLICYKCGKKNLKQKIKVEQNRLIEGSLFCSNCKNFVEVKKGVINLVNTKKTRVQETYDKYWDYMPKKFKRTKNEKEHQIFLENKNYFYKKVVLDAGCGDGRTLYSICKLKPKIIICVDFSKSIYLVANKYLRKFRKIPVVFIKLDLKKIFIKKKYFDTTICLGVVNFRIMQKKIIKNLDFLTKSTLILGLVSGSTVLGKFYHSLNFLRKALQNNKSNLLYKIFILFFHNKLFNKYKVLIILKNKVYSILEFLISPEIIRKNNYFYKKIITKKKITVYNARLIDYLFFKN